MTTGLLMDIGTEERGHLEMIGAMVHRLTLSLTDSAHYESCLPYPTGPLPYR
jgi:Mn-containing catalase